MIPAHMTTSVMIVVPLKMRSPNVYEHPMVRSKRVSKEHDVTGKCFLVQCPKFRYPWVYDPSVPKLVLMKRLGPVGMDPDDNNNSSMKNVRDAVAKLFGVNDSDPIVKWTYDQRTDPNYAVEIIIVPK